VTLTGDGKRRTAQAGLGDNREGGVQKGLVPAKRETVIFEERLNRWFVGEKGTI